MASCFRFIVCVGDDKHDLAAADGGNEEITTLSDKQQWSFRRKSSQRNAARSLHCLQALAKMQALACARMSSDKSFLVEESTQDTCDTVGQPKVDADSTPKINTSHCYSFHDKLLSNSFTRQLLKSSRNPKHLHIELNPSSHCPVWLWMERWMSLASPAMETKYDARVEWQTQKNLKLSSSVKNSPRTPSKQLLNKSRYTKNREFSNSKDSLSSVRKSYQSAADDSSAGDREPLHQKVDMSMSQPSYMKATISTKARLFASNSPRLNHVVLQEDIIAPQLRQASNKSGTHS